MERVPSPHLKKELANLGKDPDSRRTAMNALRSYVQQLDDKAIPQFLAHISELRDGQASRQYSISLYEVIAREHGKNIIPQISNIMGNVLKALSSNAPSLTLQRACAKVVSALARYTIDPSTFERQREGVLRDLSTPLLEVLLGKVETLAEGAAMCLQVLVESEAWRFAPEDIVNEVCLRVTGALEEKGTQTASHMKLVCSLANSNSLTLEPYGRSLLKAAAQILDIGVINGNWQQRLHAVQMTKSLLKSVDVGILASEIPNTIERLEMCRSDRMPSVRNAVSETLETAKAIASEMGISVSYDSSSAEEEISHQGNNSWRSSFWGSTDFSQDTQMESYTSSPVSSLQSLDTKYQTPLVLGTGTREKRSAFFCEDPGLESHSIDNVSLPEKRRDTPFSTRSQMSESVTPTEQTPGPNSSHRGNDSEYRGCNLQDSQFFDNGSVSRSISLENGIVAGSEAKHATDYEVDRESERNCLLEEPEKQWQTRSKNLEEERKYTCKELRNEETSFSFCMHYTPCLRPVHMEEEPLTPQKSGSQLTIGEISIFSSPRRLVSSLQQQSSPEFTSKKKQSRKQCQDSADDSYENSSGADWNMSYNPVASNTDDEVRGRNRGRVTVALEGRILFDKLDNVAEGVSDISDSQEEDLQDNSSVWSESVNRSKSLSSTSSSALVQEIPDNKEDLLRAGLIQSDKGSPTINEGEDKYLSADVESLESSVIPLKLHETSAFWIGWTKAGNCMEAILRGSLCAVLAVPAAMMVVKLFGRQEEYHVMVPT
eukprot:Gb_10260 [translate_table: standard]